MVIVCVATEKVETKQSYGPFSDQVKPNVKEKSGKVEKKTIN